MTYLTFWRDFVRGLILTNVMKSYGSVEAVRSVSFSMEPGQLMCLLGPSGCGKTTTLRMIAGLEFPDSGKIQLDDRVLNDLEPRERRIGMVFQGLALYSHMTAFENIAYPLKVRHVPKDQIRQRVTNIADTLGITRLLSRRPNQLSGGEQQRVALARALVQQPELFLLDEPLSALDAKVRSAMREEIRKVQKHLNITTILVSHDQLDALTMADIVAVMKNGEVQQLGSPHDIYYQPVNTFVAQFIGDPTMNMIDGEIFANSTLDFLGLKVPLDEQGSLSRPVTVGIRPQDFFPLNSHSQAPMEIEGDIVFIQPQGPDVVMRVQVGKDALVVKLPWITSWAEGEKIRLGFSPERLHVFDRESGFRLALPVSR